MDNVLFMLLSFGVIFMQQVITTTGADVSLYSRLAQACSCARHGVARERKRAKPRGPRRRITGAISAEFYGSNESPIQGVEKWIPPADGKRVNPILQNQ